MGGGVAVGDEGGGVAAQFGVESGVGEVALGAGESCRCCQPGTVGGVVQRREDGRVVELYVEEVNRIRVVRGPFDGADIEWLTGLGELDKENRVREGFDAEPDADRRQIVLDYLCLLGARQAGQVSSMAVRCASP